MSVQRWLEEVRTGCRRRRLPSAYVERLVGELSDHLTDLMEDTMSMEAFERPSTLLGSASEIVAAASSEYRRRRFSGRHPWLAFVIAPTLSLPILWAGSLSLLIFGAKALGFASESPTATAETSHWATQMLPFAVFGTLILPIVVAAVAFCLLAVKTAVSRRWMLACCLILAIVGGAANSSVSLPSPGTKGSVAFGFGVSLPPSPQQIAQFLLPLLIGCWMLHVGQGTVASESGIRSAP
ncbi:hypothetical protein I41_08750 [Lacipirellula limnantheis]|uniref:Uncharacterized protein n=1 Tax=Lacipirellula limnantheis TaxID=2528024 RepID=A0A517TTL9_9BACT|nr:hypothetical protein I41_08750 [Lacipirellula limnantheis]